MINNKVLINSNINIFKFLLLILKHLKMFIILNSLIMVFALIISRGELFNLVAGYFIVFFAGLVMSTLIHEYTHLYFFKKYGINNVVIYPQMLRFSIIPERQLKGSGLRITALSGPLSCIIIGLLLWVFQLLLYSNDTLIIVKIIYLIHSINILPMFGDGKSILKSFLV